jgi:hypothetical protein
MYNYFFHVIRYQRDIDAVKAIFSGAVRSPYLTAAIGVGCGDPTP